MRQVASLLRPSLCPFCGLQVLAEDRTLTIHHEAPVCLRFALIIQEAKPVTIETTVFVSHEPDKERSRP